MIPNLGIFDYLNSWRFSGSGRASPTSVVALSSSPVLESSVLKTIDKVEECRQVLSRLEARIADPTIYDYLTNPEAIEEIKKTDALMLQFLQEHSQQMDEFSNEFHDRFSDFLDGFVAIYNEKIRPLDFRFAVTAETEGLYGRKIPVVEIVSKKDADKKGRNVDYLPCFPRLAKAEDLKACRLVMHREEADYLVRTLGAVKHIPWANKAEGCRSRAEMTIHLLKTMGIPESSITKVWMKGDLYWGPKQSQYWRWHVAVCVTTQKGEKCIIDPALNTEKALSFEEWEPLRGDVTEKWENADLSYCLPEKSIHVIRVPDEYGSEEESRALYLEDLEQKSHEGLYKNRYGAVIAEDGLTSIWLKRSGLEATQ